MADWKQLLIDHAQHIPFFLATRSSDSPALNRLNTTRVLESLIIAGITGAITMYGVQSRLEVQLAEIKVQFLKAEQRAAEDRAESIARDRRTEDRINQLHSLRAR